MCEFVLVLVLLLLLRLFTFEDNGGERVNSVEEGRIGAPRAPKPLEASEDWLRLGDSNSTEWGRWCNKKANANVRINKQNQ